MKPVDCFIDKFSLLYPEIPKYILYANRYNFKIGIKEKDFFLDFSEGNNFFEKILDFYSIKRIELITNNDIFEKNVFPIFFPCDSFYLFYSELNYLKYHLDHFIIIREYDSNTKSFKIFDDNPYYVGKIDKNDLFASKRSDNMLIFGECNNKHSISDNLAFFIDNIYFNCFKISDSLYEIAMSEEVGIENKLIFIESLRLYFMRYNSLPIIFDSLQKEGLVMESQFEVIVQEYIDELMTVSTLAGVILRKKIKDLSRIFNKLEKIKMLEEKLNCLKGKWIKEVKHEKEFVD